MSEKEPKTSLNQTAAKPSRSVLFGAAFLMATSAIGPGFLTQTSKFTAQYGAKLIMVILLVILMDITAQMNIWSVVCVSKMRAQDVANKLLPGLGIFVAVLVAIGGLAFNIGNVGGVALGFNAMFGLNEKVGAVVAGCLGIIIFINKNAKTIMDKVATVLAAVILITARAFFRASAPPARSGSCCSWRFWAPAWWAASGTPPTPTPSSLPATPPPRPSGWRPAIWATGCSACACSPPVSPPWWARPSPPSPS